MCAPMARRHAGMPMMGLDFMLVTLGKPSAQEPAVFRFFNDDSILPEFLTPHRDNRSTTIGKSGKC